MRDQPLCKTRAKQQASKQRSKLQSFAFAGKPQAGIKPQGLSPCFSFQNENMLFSRPLFGVRKLTQNPLTPRCNKQFQSGLHFWVHFCSKRWRHVVVVFTKKKTAFLVGKMAPKWGSYFGPHFGATRNENERRTPKRGRTMDPKMGPRLTLRGLILRPPCGPKFEADIWTQFWVHGLAANTCVTSRC